MKNNTPCSFITGVAGSGKTFLMKKKVQDDSSYGIVSASTGIAAINIGATTINSLLRFYNLDSIRDKLIDQKLQPILRKLSQHYRNVIIDEASMISGETLDILYRAFQEVNDYETVETPIGLILVGDMCQLPPVNGSWAFDSLAWQHFEANTTKLDKIYRQTDPTFLSALNWIRKGFGDTGFKLLQECKVEFTKEVNTRFKGTTIFSKNAQVDNFNFISLQQVQGKRLNSKREVSGMPLSEWEKIPDTLELKIGAYVMILANKSLGYEDGISLGFEYCNGDCGYIKDYLPKVDSFAVELVRNKQTVLIDRVVRFNSQKEKPSDDEKNRIHQQYNFYPYFGPTSPSESNPENRWILGTINYHPLRLGYAATAHKTQGLSLDSVQLDIRNKFWETAGMSYVALSRARSPEGLVIVGNETLMKKRVKSDPRLRRFL